MVYVCMEVFFEINFDLVRERSRVIFDKENLINFFYGGFVVVWKKWYFGKLVNGLMNWG